MKVRFAVSPGGSGFDAAGLREFFDELEAQHFDTVWLSDLPLGAVLDPIVGLGFAAARTTKLKLGANIVPLGRNPMSLAKELAQLDQLSNGRVLISLVPGIDQPGERTALGVGGRDRGRLIEEMIPLLRAWWAGEPVTHQGEPFSYDGISVAPRPVQQPLEIWLGGNGPRALVRIGQLADGWLGAALTPAEAGEAIGQIRASADAAGRMVDDDHFGLSIPYTRDDPDPALYEALRRRRPDGDVEQLLPVGGPALRALVHDHVEHGVTKFVLRPSHPLGAWNEELAWLAGAILDLQT